ncbi:MAG: C39 family peptidase [Clostridium sp.]|nr:C39 family peptidase [Clostridium sp.]
MDEYEELTDEEMRRRREATRRRKMAARERRRRKRRQEAIVRCSILLIIVILLIVGIVKGISGLWKHFHEKKKDNDKVSEQVMEPTTEMPTTEEFKVDSSILAADIPADREAALTILKERAESESDADLQNICDNAAVYSDRVLINLAANPELKQFTIDYLTKVTVAYDGEFTMDVSTDNVPLLLQYDEHWGYADYGDNLLAYNGAAPTCLAMAASYLKKDAGYNPIKIGDFAMANGYLDENDKTSWDLMTAGTSQLGLSCNELSINEGNMKANLDEGEVIICCVQAGDFTKDEHYIVIYGYDDYKFLVNDPASQARSEIAWPFERLSSQIKNMWAIGVDSQAAPEDNNNTTDDAGDNSTDGNDTAGDAPTSTDGNDATANTDNE